MKGKTAIYTAWIIVFASMIIASHSKLQIANFDQLSPELQDKDLLNIPYSVANFGFAPFGKTMVGHMVQSPGLSTQCETTMENLQEDQQNKLENAFLVIPRGQCQFVTKAVHAQQLGARMAIIIDNVEHQRPIIMKDNGYGYKVNIPAIFINYSYGQKLTSLIEKSQKQVMLRISFDSIKSDKVNVTFYLQATNRMAYYLVENFQPFYDKIKNHINLDIVYDIMNCSFCAETDCYFDKGYCAVHYSHGQSSNGKMILDQQLRETIMFEKHRDQWWGYMQCINNQCNQITELKTCSDACLSRVNVLTLNQQFANSFSADKNNIYLQQDLEMLQFAGINSFPSVAVNDIKMRGSLQAQFIFDDICNTLINPPSQCKYYVSQQSTSYQYQQKIYWLTVILVVFISALVFTLLFVCCKRWMKKRMTNDMQGRVDDMVSKYIEFYSQRQNN